MRCLSSWDIFKPMNLNYVEKNPTALSVWTLRDNFSTLEQYTSIYLFFFLQYPCSFLVLTTLSLFDSHLFLSPPVIVYISPSEKNLYFVHSPLFPLFISVLGFGKEKKNQEGGRGKRNGCFPSNMWPLLSSQLKIIWVYRPVDGWLVRTSSSSSGGKSLCWWLAEGKLWASNWKHDIWAL